MVAQRVLGNPEQPRSRSTQAGIEGFDVAESSEKYLCSQIFCYVRRGHLESQVMVECPAVGTVPLAAGYLGLTFDACKG